MMFGMSHGRALGTALGAYAGGFAGFLTQSKVDQPGGGWKFNLGEGIKGALGGMALGGTLGAGVHYGGGKVATLGKRVGTGIENGRSMMAARKLAKHHDPANPLGYEIYRAGKKVRDQNGFWLEPNAINNPKGTWNSVPSLNDPLNPMNPIGKSTIRSNKPLSKAQDNIWGMDSGLIRPKDFELDDPMRDF